MIIPNYKLLREREMQWMGTAQIHGKPRMEADVHPAFIREFTLIEDGAKIFEFLFQPLEGRFPFLFNKLEEKGHKLGKNWEVQHLLAVIAAASADLCTETSVTNKRSDLHPEVSFLIDEGNLLDDKLGFRVKRGERIFE